MRISSVAVPLLLLMHAELLTIEASAEEKHSKNVNIAAPQWHILEHNTNARDHTTPQNKVISSKIGTHIIKNKPPWEKRTSPELKQYIISPYHRFRRKAHYHYKTGESFQHFRHHHLKTTTQWCGNTHPSKLKAIDSTLVNCQVKQTTHVETKRTTRKPKDRLWGKLLDLKKFLLQNDSANKDLQTQENILTTESVRNDAEKTTYPITTQSEDKSIHQNSITHEPTSVPTTSHTNTTHPTTNTSHVTLNSTSMKQTMENHTTTKMSNAAESLKTTEKPTKQLLNWLLHPHISHKHIAHYELEKKYYMAILLVADNSFVKYHSNTDYDTYIMTVMNMAADYMRDVSLGVNLELVIARTMYLEEGARPFETDSEMGSRLEHFCDWAQKINPKDANHPSHHDVAILITRQADECTEGTCEPLGAAYAGGACVEGKSCLLAQDRGLLTAVTIAHQLGHLLGAPHDDGPNCQCPSEGVDNSTSLFNLVMSTKPNHGSLVWSNCSRRFVTSFFRQGMASCLEDEPPKSLRTFPEVLPGVMYDADQQCNMLVRGSRSCFINSMEFCTKLICRTSNKTCYYNGDRPSQGTPCGVNKWCWSGACVQRGWRPLAVGGGWGAWGGWGACSRTCGGGVQRASRACTAPPPHAGGPYCAGDALRHRTCHTRPCEPNAPSFRAVQCTAFDRVPLSGSRHAWRALAADAADPCGLYCASGTGVGLRLSPRAADGTPCAPGSRHMCIDGVCTRVGCDWVIDSSVSEDRCGVCGGDGMHCHLVQGWYNVTNTTQLGYQLITVIPKGSRKINIYEVYSSTNDLAISNVTTKKGKEWYFLIGNKSANAEGEFTILSVRGVHTHSEPGKDFIIINGPLPVAIKIYVILKCEHASIHYSYMDIHATAHVDKSAPNDTDILERRQRNPFLERNNPLHWSRYRWEHLEWGPCSARCQVGTSVCAAHCVSVWFGRVSDSYCAGTKKPHDLVRVCNEQPCRARWQTGQWSECYRGTQWRYVQCMREGRSYFSPSMPVDGSCCRCTRPQSTRRCHEGSLKKISKDSILVTTTDTFTTPFYFDMLSAEKTTPSSTYSTNAYITPEIKFNIIQFEKVTQSTQNFVKPIGYSTDDPIHVKDNTEVPNVSQSIEDIEMNIQNALENLTESNISSSNLNPYNMDAGIYASNGSETATMLYSELETLEPRAHRECNETIKHNSKQLDSPVLSYSDGIIGIREKSKYTDVISTLVSESTTQKTKTKISHAPSLQVENSKIVSKPKLHPKKKSRLSELKKLIFSKRIIKREVIKNTHDNLHVETWKHLDDKHTTTKELRPINKQTQPNLDDSYLILYLRKKCITEINNIFDKMGTIKLIFRDDYQENINANKPINKISTGVEDTYGNKIYDFDDFLHSNSFINLTNCSKVYKKLCTNEFVTKIPLKLLNTVVTFRGSTNKLTGESHNTERNVWSPSSTINHIVSNTDSPSFPGKVFPFENTTSNYFKTASGEITNIIEKKNEAIGLDLKRGRVTIRSLYNIVNIYCANASQIKESMTQSRNEMHTQNPLIDNSNPWNQIEDKYHTNKAYTELNFNNSNDYYIEIPLSPLTTKNNKRGLGFLNKYKKMFRKNKNNSRIYHQAVHSRHFRSIAGDFDFKKRSHVRDIIRSIYSQVNETSQSSNSDVSTHRPMQHQPETVTPKCKKNIKRKNNHYEECKGTTKLLASSNKREAENEVTQDPMDNNSISEITTTESPVVLFSNLKIVKDFMPVDKILDKKVSITGTKCLLNNLTEISNRELGDEIPTFNFGS